MKKVRITQIRSIIDRPKDQKATIEALGLRKIGSSKEIEVNPQLNGMIRKVAHLLKVEEI